ncbi:hypothetical protein LTR62_008060 [Meristemomyces frigidus]|uniref:carnosine N-methyltransferase n=1 Tax=Meristemomyces frigidus TaxID=1508187 RepID=A0AAN7TI67_9PEZI|nr:hypothetical protein LTR62_008060 [Meristemomyces frigidus]
MTPIKEAASTVHLKDHSKCHELFAALDSFRQYRQLSHYNTTHLRRQTLYSLPAEHIDLLCAPPISLLASLDAIDSAIAANADIAEAMLDAALVKYGLQGDESWKGTATVEDVDRARSTIRQLYRDWSLEGAGERAACYVPILSALEKYLPTSNDPAVNSRDRVLVPGSGLGRLVLDLRVAGYTVEGNDSSYHQLIASQYMLDCANAGEQHKLYPWALNANNHLTRADQLQSVSVPDTHGLTAWSDDDIDSTLVGGGARMGITYGEFTASYNTPKHVASFAAVVTCFFIDTAPNIIAYIEVIRHCLKLGGVWINLGPLLWHFATTAPKSGTSQSDKVQDRGSIELTGDEVVALVGRMGFDIIEVEHLPAGAAGYVQDPASMLQNSYRPTYWVARKRAVGGAAAVAG